MTEKGEGVCKARELNYEQMQLHIKAAAHTHKFSNHLLMPSFNLVVDKFHFHASNLHQRFHKPSIYEAGAVTGELPSRGNRVSRSYPKQKSNPVTTASSN